jgi:GTP-binding protein
MGIKFLKHVERTSLLFHIIDISMEPNTNAWSNFTAINEELGYYNPELLEKPQIVALNKIDLPFVKDQAKKEVALFKKKGIILHLFSAVTGEGIPEILNKMIEGLNQTGYK